MKKYINLLTISLFVSTCLFIAGDAFALKFKSDKDRIQFCETIKDQIKKTRIEIEKINRDKNNIDHTKLKKLMEQYESLREDLDQASCNDL